ncbi:MAG TPA: hypothetical protein VK726_16595 [Acetobacteraceae bacterium]|nr:hypothetical protein [Acetobacteraceae bacterium]
MIRSLVERITLHDDGDEWRAKIRGELAAILMLAGVAVRVSVAIGGVAWLVCDFLMESGSRAVCK